MICTKKGKGVIEGMIIKKNKGLQSKYRIASYFRGEKYHEFLQLHENIIGEKKVGVIL